MKTNEEKDLAQEVADKLRKKFTDKLSNNVRRFEKDTQVSLHKSLQDIAKIAATSGTKWLAQPNVPGLTAGRIGDLFLDLKTLDVYLKETKLGWVKQANLAGTPGKDAITPVKGVDYFDGKDGYTPIKGRDYFDGKDGKDAKEIEMRVHNGYIQWTREGEPWRNLISVEELKGAPGRAVRIGGGSGGGAWGSITGTLSDQTDLQTELDSKMELTGTYSFGSNFINLYGGASGIDIDTYTPKKGEFLRVRTGGSKNFGSGTIYAEQNDLLYYDNTEWKLIKNFTMTVGALTANSLLATGGTTNQLISLNPASYPSLTEVSYVKGVTSAIQTQLNAKGDVTSSSTNTFTNKSINANGTGNSITNLETADFAANVIDTDYLMAADSDTRLATQKATKSRIYAKTAAIKPTSGDWYSMGGQTAAGTAGLNAAGRLVFHPIWLDEGTISEIAVSTSVAAASTWRLGLYEADPVTGLPDGMTPFWDAGTVNMNNTAGVQTIVSSKAVTKPGLYWAAALVDAYTAQPTTHNVTYSSNSGVGILGLPQDMSSLGRYRVGRTYGSTVATGSLPTAPTSSMSWAGTVPRIAVKYS